MHKIIILGIVFFVQFFYVFSLDICGDLWYNISGCLRPSADVNAPHIVKDLTIGFYFLGLVKYLTIYVAVGLLNI